MRKLIGKIKSESKKKQLRRKLSIRKKISGTAAVPRLCANKTNANLLVQAIDDNNGITLFSVKTFGKTSQVKGNSRESASKLAVEIAAEMKKRNLERAVFDRNGKKYTGVISVLAQTLRDNGISI